MRPANAFHEIPMIEMDSSRLGRTAVRPYILVALVLSLGTFMRFHALDRQSLWDDEFSTLRTVSTPARQLIQRFETYETHPPLYFLQLKIWRALHFRSLVKLRANSALWGSLSLFLIFLVGRLYGGEALGFLAMSLLAVSPFHLAYSQELRPYAMAVAIALAALLALERRSWVLVGCLWTAQLYTHYWGAFVVIAQAIYGCTLHHPSRVQAPRHPSATGALADANAVVASGVGAARIARRRAVRAWDPWVPPRWPAGMTPVLICAGAAFGLFALWIPVLFQQMGVIDRLVFWASPFSIKSLAKVFLAYSSLFFNMASSAFYLRSSVGVFVGVGLVFAAALGMGFWRPGHASRAGAAPTLAPGEQSGRGPKAAKVWLVIGLGIPWILGYWKPTLFLWYRYTTHMLPAFVLLVAAGFLSVRPRLLKIALILIGLGSQVWGDWTYFHGWQKANPKAVVAYIHRLRQPNTLVIRPSYFADLFAFYDLGTTPVADEHLLDDPDKRAALHGRNILFVAFDVPSDPVGDALLREYKPVSARYFPGTAHLGITVYELGAGGARSIPRRSGEVRATGPAPSYGMGIG